MLGEWATADFKHCLSILHEYEILDTEHELIHNYDHYIEFLILQEYEIDKTLGIKGPDDVAEMGIATYNAECRKIVTRYAKEWEVSIQIT